MKSVLFVTGNRRKFEHMSQACAPYDIVVQQLELPIDEIQSHDPMAISSHKAAEAFRLTGRRPVVVNDSFWTIPALQGFPGGYMKDVHTWFTAEDWLRLMYGIHDRRICVTETLIYTSAQETKVFTKDYWLQITTGRPRGKGTSLEQVVEERNDSRTIAEYHEKGVSTIPVTDYIWGDFAAWYAKR